MELPRVLAPAAASALLAVAAVSLAPAASAQASQPQPGAAGLPAASAVVPVLASAGVTVTASSSRTSTTATADWTLPACSGTVYAVFVLRQSGVGGASAYVQEKGTTAYPCQPAPQTVTVRYHAADPSQGVLTTSAVELATTTYTAASGGDATSSTTTPAPAVASSAGLPRASRVVPRFLQGVSLHQDPSSPTGVTAAARWVVPACTGTVRAAFTLFQDGEPAPRAAQGPAPTAYPCSPADQLVTVRYAPASAGSPAVHAGAADLWVDTFTTTKRGATGRQLQSARTAATAS